MRVLNCKDTCDHAGGVMALSTKQFEPRPFLKQFFRRIRAMKKTDASTCPAAASGTFSKSTSNVHVRCPHVWSFSKWTCAQYRNGFFEPKDGNVQPRWASTSISAIALSFFMGSPPTIGRGRGEPEYKLTNPQTLFVKM